MSPLRKQRRRMQGKGCSPAVELEGDLAPSLTLPREQGRELRGQAGGRPAVGVMTTFRWKTSPRSRAFRLAAPVVVGEAGRQAAFVCARAAFEYTV